METLTKKQNKSDSSFVDLFNDWKELNTNDSRTTFKLDLIEKFITDTKDRILASKKAPKSYRASLIDFLEKLSVQKELLENELKGESVSTEETQLCSNCFKEVPYNQRYPQYICKDCYNKEMRDEYGTLVKFRNKDFSGGLVVIYCDDNEQEMREEYSFSKFECYIDGKPFIAREARFGGIVIQKMD
jgi:hypothetical protein